MLDKDTLALLRGALASMESELADLPAFSPPRVDADGLATVLNDVAARLAGDDPFFHPLYAAQMQQPPHSVARLAYALALWTNPNNHARVGGRASAQMEREAVAGIARMIGWDRFAGHLCGGGTLANTEALWVASRAHPGVVVASAASHYLHARMSRVLGLPFETIATDRALRIDEAALAARLARGGVGTVVATIGTTATGSVDALPPLLRLRERYGFRLHLDAAYGGYFGLADNLADETRASFALLAHADSIVVDPHKHGLQPYGVSCALFRNPDDGRYFRDVSSPCALEDDDAPAHETGFECSRPGASAVALWATMRLLPLVAGGEFAAMLRAARAAAIALHARLAADVRFIAPIEPDLDIVVWTMRAVTADEASALARDVRDECRDRDVHLSLAELPSRLFGDAAFCGARERTIGLRATLMKADHLAWVERIHATVREATDVVVLRRRSRATDARTGATRMRPSAVGNRSPQVP
jgi:glutamate/tyrosine decarboxylase-like PLP-dependent enzyme